MKNTEFSIRLKTLMAKKSLKIRDLAEAMNCSMPTVSAWRSGTIPTSIKTQQNLARILDVDVEGLIYGGKSELVFSNSKCPNAPELREKINNRVKQILDDAEGVSGGLEHFYLELLIRFPHEIYKNLGK